MRILKIIHGYPPDYQAGSEVYSQSLCNELARRGHTVGVCTREENPYLPDFHLRTETLANGVTLFRYNLPREKDGYRHPQLDLLFAQAVRQFQPDVAHIGHLNHLSTGWTDILKAQNIPIVFTLHDFWLMCPRGQFLQTNFAQPEYYQLCHSQENAKCARECYRAYWGNSADDPDGEAAWTRWVAQRMAETRKVCEQVDVFIAPSQTLRSRFVNDFQLPEEKIQYLDYGFPLQYLKPVEVTKRDVFTFGYIGTHIPPKGIDLLIGAFLQLEQPARLIIWGRSNGTSTAHLKKMAAQSRNPIEFRGEYQNENIAQEVFAQIDAIIVPSIWIENSPLVIHEAQACQKPVITANVGGMAEYVQHQTNGLLFEHRNAQDLLAQMQFSVENPQFIKTLGNRGYLFTENGLPPSIEEHTVQIISIYQTLQSKKHG